MPTHAFTIGKLAQAAGVTVETVRYWQQRGLLPCPARASGTFRLYDADALRIARFVRRALELGFSLDEAQTLLQLSKQPDRAPVREIAHRRALEIRQRAATLERLADGLEQLAARCEVSEPPAPCPILAALAAVEEGLQSGAGQPSPSA